MSEDGRDIERFYKLIMTSILVLTQPIQRIIPLLPKLLEAAAYHVNENLYVHLDDFAFMNTPKKFRGLAYRSHIISSIYTMSPILCPGVNIHVIMSGFKNKNASLTLKPTIEKLLIDSCEFSSLEKKYKEILNTKNSHVLLKNEANVQADTEDLGISKDQEDKIFNDVVCGGTFDRIHPGHKILLSEAVLRCLKRLTVGVSDGPLLKRKILKELILPCSTRIDFVREFLTKIDPHLTYNIVPIDEPMGPTAFDPDMEMIVVSEETYKGVKLINDHRINNGLNTLEYFCIKIFQDCLKHYKEEEDKFSSSSVRMRLLGTRIREPTPNQNIPSFPYIIGLTGGSASGKTNIGRKLKDLGAGVIDCDKLGHKAYEFGTECYKKLVSNFGQEILDEDKNINRRVLGSLVFNKPEKLKELTDIVWPQIAVLANEEIQRYRNIGKKVVILDAAVLLEAEWDKFCHEIWVTIIDRVEAIRRIVERDNLSEEAAAKRIDNQMSNQERVNRANIVFCSLWAHEYTKQQVDNAWKILEREGKL